jgi:multiple sugar transport system substrate-binding protein
MTRTLAAAMLAAALCAGLAACGDQPRVLTFSGSAVGREADVVRRQLDRFQQANPGIRVELRATPDSADQRHQLYVQWLNAYASEPDVLQLDVIWTAEFAAAGWIAALDRFSPPADQFFPSTVDAHRWSGSLYALPWFVDVGMLYWRTDLMPHAPRTLDQLGALAAQAQRDGNVRFGWIWQGARYEGLVTVFLELLGAYGGSILDAHGSVAVDSPAAIEALTFMRDAIYRDGIVPAAVLTWQEEQTRFAFASGQAAFMRNWPYAFALLQDRSESQVAGHVAVAAMPATPAGAPTSALGGSTLAINAHSDQPDDAYRLMAFLLQPEQMIERAQIAGQLPTRPALYDTPELAAALDIPPADARAVVERAVPRPVTPVYSQLSGILQVWLHRALTRQESPDAALRRAGEEMRALLARVRLETSTR